MDKIFVKLLHHTPLSVCVKAIRTCWDSMDKSDTESISETDSIGQKDKELIHRVGNINKHKSVLEHLHYTFSINGISRACLQELARHRMASLSVKSTRYTLKELKNVEFHNNPLEMENFFVSNGNNEIDSIVEQALLELQECLQCGISQDIAKYMLPESYRTGLVWSINARSLQNFLHLRSSKAALKEIQILARLVFENLPATHKYLFSEFVKESGYERV